MFNAVMGWILGVTPQRPSLQKGNLPVLKTIIDNKSLSSVLLLFMSRTVSITAKRFACNFNQQPSKDRSIGCSLNDPPILYYPVVRIKTYPVLWIFGGICFLHDVGRDPSGISGGQFGGGCNAEKEVSGSRSVLCSSPRCKQMSGDMKYVY